MKDDALRRNFVRRLNYYMDANKLTQADLARHMGVCTHLLAILLAQKKRAPHYRDAHIREENDM